MCRSTLAAEASAADEACDRTTFLNMFLSELLYDTRAHKVGARLLHLHCTETKSLYDSAVQENPNMSDKRSLVSVRAIQEVVPARILHWVPTQLQFADGDEDPGRFEASLPHVASKPAGNPFRACIAQRKYSQCEFCAGSP